MSQSSSSAGSDFSPQPVQLPGGYTGRLLNSSQQTEPFLREWEDLCRHALEPNLFFEPWQLLPAWQHLGNPSVSLLMLFSPRDELHGLVPLQARRRYHRMPIAGLSVWRHLHCPFCVPLIRQGAEPDTLRAFLAWLRTGPLCTQLLTLESISADGPFWMAFRDILRAESRRFYEDDHWVRAMIRPGPDADSYLEQALSTKRRRELRRQWNRLGEKGSLAFVKLAPEEDPGPWLEEFYALEQAGWKGRSGTAIANREAEQRYFEQVARSAHARGRLMMLALRLEGRTIAMNCNFLAEGGSYAAKIAYDETHASYSPGVQLELHHLRLLHERSDIPWMDSCTVPGHFMMEGLWSERRPMLSVTIGVGFRGNLMLAALPAAVAVRSRLKRSPTPGPSHRLP